MRIRYLAAPVCGGFWNSTIDDPRQRLIAYSANRRWLWKSKNGMRSIALMLCALSVLGAAEDFPLKRVPQLTYLVDYEASWSPDGRSIVLISSRHGGLKVHILDASSDGHGSDMRQITISPNEDDSPAWSPNASPTTVLGGMACSRNFNGVLPVLAV